MTRVPIVMWGAGVFRNLLVLVLLSSGPEIASAIAAITVCAERSCTLLWPVDQEFQEDN